MSQSTYKIFCRLLFAICFFISTFVVHAQVSVPVLQARVTDLTATLSYEQSQKLEQKLEIFEKEKGSQIAVLIVSTTQPEALEQFSIRVVDSWKLGRKNIDDGVLLLIATQDRRMRIEVGRGLEGVLTDITSKQIIEDIIKPYFKQGDTYQGIDAGLSAIIKVVSGEKLPTPSNRGRGNSPLFALAIVIFIAFIFLIILLQVFEAPSNSWNNNRNRSVYRSGGGFRGSSGGFSGGGGGFSGGGASGSW